MPIPVSEDFKNTMRSPAKMLAAKIEVLDDSGRVFSSADDLSGFIIESRGNYFGAAISIGSFKLIGTDFDLVGSVVKITTQALVDPLNETYDDLVLGEFTINEQTVDLERGVSSFKFYNQMGVMATADYLAGDIEFPCTVASMAQQIADKFVIDLVTDMATLPNHDYIITEDLYEKINNTKYRDILSEIAGATASICLINSQNQLEFRPVSKIPIETWTYDNLKKIKYEDKYGPVNSVVLARTPQEDNTVDKDDVSITENGLTEVKLANNEILDDDRESLVTPILNAANGFYYYPFEATTEGHGWHEIGDRITATDGTNSWELVITSIKLEIGPGIKELIKGVAPDATQTDYARSGGIMKTIYNTEIKVDRQNQQIESIVGRQDEFEGELQDNFTQIIQDITNIVSSVQNSGGANLIRNSVGYSLDDQGLPNNWVVDISGGSISVISSGESIAHGSLSGNVMILAGSEILQRIPVVADTGAENSPRYSFSVRIKKGAVGSGSITLTDGIEIYSLDFEPGDNPYYDLFSIQDILPKNNYLDLAVSGSPDSDFAVTDMMMSVGDYVSQWTQANGEFANTQVNIDINGVTVRSSTVQGIYSLQTPFRFAGYRNGSVVYSLDESAVKSKKAILEEGIEMPPLKIVKMEKGWAWVRMEGN